MEINFMKGNEAAAEAAIRAGLDGFFFYPLTPSSEIGEYMAQNLEKTGGKFVQAESELAAVNMMLGGASVGARVMTGTSGVGFSLMTEGLSYMAGSELPALVVDVQRAGPGLGSLEPTQADYNQVAKACGHGGHMIPAYAPGDAQEIVDSIYAAYDTAFRFRTPVIVTYEACTGQVMESVRFPETSLPRMKNDWAYDDEAGRESRVIHSGYAGNIGDHLKALNAKYAQMEDVLQQWEEYMTEDAELILVGFGMVGRICRTVVNKARASGLKIGLIRPVTISPFPKKAFAKFHGSSVKFLAVEISRGLMVNDLIVALGSDANVGFFADEYCHVPKAAQIMERAEALLRGV